MFIVSTEAIALHGVRILLWYTIRLVVNFIGHETFLALMAEITRVRWWARAFTILMVFGLGGWVAHFSLVLES